MRRLLRVNISSPGPLAAWPEVISQHRSDIMMSVLALKVSDWPAGVYEAEPGCVWPQQALCGDSRPPACMQRCGSGGPAFRQEMG